MLRRLHRDERGQIVPFFMVGMLALAVFLALLLNTGEQVAARRQTQDAADAIALSEAAWTARSLNVMAMNNVAITQSFSLNILANAVLPPLSEASIRATAKGAQYVQEWGGCASWTYAAWICYGWVGYKIYLLVDRVILPLKRLWDDNPYAIARNFATMTRSLERMNETLVTRFSQQAATLAKELAKENGLGEERTILYSKGLHAANTNRQEGLGLPVTPVSLGNLDLPLLCTTGQWGTPAPGIDWNFQEHGYPQRRGPYLIGKESANAALSAPIDALAGFPHYSRVIADFRKIVDAAWVAACASRTLGVPDVRTVKLYKLKNAPLPLVPLGDRRNDWSLLAFVRRQQDNGIAAPSLFANPVHFIHAYAQAEVYNDVNYDLYTQDWHARLVPARLLNSAKRADIFQAIAPFRELRQAFERIPEAEWKRVNAH